MTWEVFILSVSNDAVFAANALDRAACKQRVQMGERFAEGEALLRGRKVGPVFRFYPPGHQAGKLVCCDARALVNEPLGLVEPQPVVLYQLLRSLTQRKLAARSVRRERGFDISSRLRR